MPKRLQLVMMYLVQAYEDGCFPGMTANTQYPKREVPKREVMEQIVKDLDAAEGHSLANLFKMPEQEKKPEEKKEETKSEVRDKVISRANLLHLGLYLYDQMERGVSPEDAREESAMHAIRIMGDDRLMEEIASLSSLERSLGKK